MRTARIKVDRQAAVYHCTTRIVGGQMLLENRAKEVLRKQIWQVADFCGVEVLTYCVMTNHFHVLVRVPEPTAVSDAELVRRYGLLYHREPHLAEALEGTLKAGGGEAEAWRKKLLARMHDISKYMKELKQRFSIWYNKSHNRYGTLWAERFKSVLVENSPTALRTVAAYIDLNAVRAGLCQDLKDYRWCAYAEAMGGSKQAQGRLSEMVEEPCWKEAAPVYRMILFGMGYEPKTSGQPSIDPEKVKKVLDEGGKLPLAEVLHCRVRYFTDGAVLGSKEFVQAYFQAHRGRFGKNRKSGPRTMVGSDWQGLTVLRDLRREVFG